MVLESGSKGGTWEKKVAQLSSFPRSNGRIKSPRIAEPKSFFPYNRSGVEPRTHMIQESSCLGQSLDPDIVKEHGDRLQRSSLV